MMLAQVTRENVMRYRCDACGTSEWRGLFPEQTFHLRYAVFHGVALGIASVITKRLFERLEYAAEGGAGGLASLATCAVILLLIYGIAVIGEQCVMMSRRCSACSARSLRPG
jgi:hypothetical protein